MNRKGKRMPRSYKEKTDQIELFQQRLFDLTQDEIAKGRRDEKGRMTCTIRSIAEEIGISPAALSTWRTGKIKGIPQVDYLRKIADHYDVTVEWLSATPGAEKNRNTTLAATGLSSDAIENLISIHELFNSTVTSLLKADLLSQILSGPHFMDLASRFRDLAILADYIEGQMKLLEEASQTDSDAARWYLDEFNIDQFELEVSNLDHGRYGVFEACNGILDSLCKKPVVDTVKRARKIIDQAKTAEEEFILKYEQNIAQGKSSAVIIKPPLSNQSGDALNTHE